MKYGYNFFPVPFFLEDLLKTSGQHSTGEGYLIISFSY